MTIKKFIDLNLKQIYTSLKKKKEKKEKKAQQQKLPIVKLKKN